MLFPIKLDTSSHVTTITNDLVHWADPPFVGLDVVKNLDIESKRKTLFGHSAINHAGIESKQAVIFAIYLDIELPHRTFEKIHIPIWFLTFCDFFKTDFPDNWGWSPGRRYDLSCAMNKARYNRVLTSCWLANNQNDLNFTYTQCWNADEKIATVDELLQIGNLKDWTGQWGPAALQLPSRSIPNNLDGNPITSIFKVLYDPVFSQSASCVVIGAVGWEWACEVCEKYLCAVYSGCIPVVHGYKIYDRLRDLGFDTFSDIIDTSSQYDKNPITAVWHMLSHNKKFFKQAKDIVKTSEIQARLKHNFNRARDIASIYQASMEKLNSPKAIALYDRNKKIIDRYLSDLYEFDLLAYQKKNKYQSHYTSNVR